MQGKLGDDRARTADPNLPRDAPYHAGSSGTIKWDSQPKWRGKPLLRNWLGTGQQVENNCLVLYILLLFLFLSFPDLLRYLGISPLVCLVFSPTLFHITLQGLGRSEQTAA